MTARKRPVMQRKEAGNPVDHAGRLKMRLKASITRPGRQTGLKEELGVCVETTKQNHATAYCPRKIRVLNEQKEEY